MSVKKKILALLLLTAILATVVWGLLWHTQHYQIIDFRMYPRDAQELDLRGQEISIAHYNKIRRRMPGCTVYWDIPIQGNYYPQDTRELVLQDLTQEDAEALAFFPRLETLDARGCEDYALLQMVQRTYPQVRVLYTVTIGGRDYDQDAQVLYVDGIAARELERIQYLPRLAQVRLESSRDGDQLEALNAICQQRDIPVLVVLGGEVFDTTETAVEIANATAEDLSLLRFLPYLNKVHFADPQMPPEQLMQFVRERTDIQVTWSKTVLGISFPGDARELDLTAGVSKEGARAYELAKSASVQGTRDEITYLFAVDSDYPLPDLSGQTGQMIGQVEQAMGYFPNARQVLLCGAVLDNEAMASWRARARENYKVVWSVQCGDKMVARTDATYFMPTKYHVYYFLDDDAVNLKYCEEMICVDLGHMAISNIDWVAYMPNLQYLVLAHTQLKYIDPISSCKKLKFLELDWSPIRDYTPLKGCTSLEDLNLGKTYADFTPIGEMTWLRNLWMVDCSQSARSRMPQLLPDTRVMVSGSATVANGWRTLPNYYAMRDAMGMFYMKW